MYYSSTLLMRRPGRRTNRQYKCIYTYRHNRTINAFILYTYNITTSNQINENWGKIISQTDTICMLIKCVFAFSMILISFNTKIFFLFHIYFKFLLRFRLYNFSCGKFLLCYCFSENTVNMVLFTRRVLWF